ncbi:TetR/AcrR family transcriptional regulator [Streptomyces fuscichromogenes]|uniref:TetR/AcrR family transcriptional regulator n=1 Tax=Streptomyces fuscichromogenes TaxID=1324013 RepID=UPI0038048B86
MPKKTATKPSDETSATKAARTRERILDAAAHVLSRKGFAGTRLSDVAVQAELQAPAIYYYFSSREDLIEEVMWAGLARMHQHLQAALDALPAELDPMDRLMAAVDEHLRYQLSISDYATAAIRNSGQLPEKIRSRQLVEENTYGDIWRDLVDDVRRAGQLRDDLDPRTARMLVLGALSWTAEWWNPLRGSLDELVRTAQSLVRHGLAPVPQGEGGGTAQAAGQKARTRRKSAPAA